MKKFLVLSFLMVLFAGAVSFAQTRTERHYISNPPPVRNITYTIQEPNPYQYRYQYYAWLNAGQFSAGEIDVTNISASIEFLDGHYEDYNRSTSGTDGAWVDFGCDITQVRKIWYAFEIFYTDGSFEIYDVFDTYQ